MSSDAPLKVNKDNGDVDAITASTITSRAFLKAVNRAFDAYINESYGATGASSKADGATCASPKADGTTGASLKADGATDVNHKEKAVKTDGKSSDKERSNK